MFAGVILLHRPALSHALGVPLSRCPPQIVLASRPAACCDSDLVYSKHAEGLPFSLSFTSAHR